jgi:hypothetical protein
MKNIVLLLTGLLIAANTDITVHASELTVSDKGLGEITATTKFDKKEIQGHLSGYVVKSDTSSTEGEEFPVLLVFDHKSVLATINPTEDEKKIFSIRVTSNKISNALGPKIGMTFASIYGGTVPESCSAGMEELSGTVICQDPKSEHILYIFNGKYDGPDGEIPNISVLINFKVSEIVWRP